MMDRHQDPDVSIFRVLMILDREFPSDVRVENEISILQQFGIEVHLLVLTFKDRPSYEITQSGLRIHRSSIGALTYKSSVGCLRHPMYFNFWRRAIEGVLEKVIINAIHVHDLPLARLGREVADELSIPFILDLHENWPYMLDIAEHTNTPLGKLLSRPAQWRRYEKEMVNSADAVITVVGEMKDRIVALGATKEKVLIYQNVPDLQLGRSVEEKKLGGVFTLYYAGGINIHRGIQIVLDALAIMADAGHELIFIVHGDGSYLRELTHQAQRLKVASMVQFMGKVSQKEVIRTLAKADLAIVPHLRNVQNDNSSPNKLFQYMLAGTAVISSNCTSLQRVVESTQAGLIYQHDSQTDLAEKLMWATQHREELGRMGDRGRIAVTSTYNMEQCSRELIELYSDLSSK